MGCSLSVSVLCQQLMCGGYCYSYKLFPYVQGFSCLAVTMSYLGWLADLRSFLLFRSFVVGVLDGSMGDG